jgi:threonine dehydrogenase-like Zn-dependent dehydrogenase
MKSTTVFFPERNRIGIRQEDVNRLSEDQVLCKSDISLISIGTELRCLRGEIDPGTNWYGWVQYPFKPGYSMTGTVIEAGANVKDFKIGDKVVTQQTHCQYFTDTPANPNLMKIPEGISSTEASWQILGCITQLGARRPEIRLGDHVGIIGLGMLGQLVTQYIKMMGARSIIAMDVSDTRLNLAREHGATHTLKGDVKDAYDSIKDITKGKMLDVVYDITGLPMVLSSASRLVRRLGKVVLLGDNTEPSKQNLGPNVVSDSVSILGIHGSMCPDFANEFNPWTWREMANLFFELILDGRMRVAPMTKDVFSPLEAEKVYNWLNTERPDTTGVVFDWSKLD